MNDSLSTSQKQVKYWVNSIPNTVCALFDDIVDLKDGRVIVAIVRTLVSIGFDDFDEPFLDPNR